MTGFVFKPNADTTSLISESVAVAVMAMVGHPFTAYKRNPVLPFIIFGLKLLQCPSPPCTHVYKARSPNISPELQLRFFKLRPGFPYFLVHLLAGSEPW